MTPATAAALRCPVCQGPLLQVGRTLRCPKTHSFDLAKEGYANLLPIQKKACRRPRRRQGDGASPPRIPLGRALHPADAGVGGSLC